mmetsp:Transcript_90120/g.226851  ORF Transcript_90120/g.226851 Transcript_90120/m.226851 type:complete len:903 (+) Transcript_90120:67-2775(+)
MASTDGGDEAPKKKKRQINLNREIVIKRLSRKHRQKKPSTLAQLQEIFEEAEDKARFVGDTMFWKYFEDIEIARIKDTKSVEYMNLRVMFWETLFYLIILVFFTTYVYLLQSRDVFDARQEQQEYWSGCDAYGRCQINEVNSVETFWEFMNNQFITRAFTEYPEPQMNVANILTEFGQNDFPITWHPRFVGPQKSNIMLGAVRVRQTRVLKNVGCQVSKLYAHIHPDCYGHYSEASKSTKTYKPRFAPTYIAGCYDYVTAEQTAQASVDGKLVVYGGDGFMFDLPWNATDSRTMLGDLRSWGWLDQATRAVIVEFTTLNTNVNVIVNNRVIFEFGTTGAVVGSVTSTGGLVTLFTPATSTSAGMTLFAMQIVLLILFVIFTVYACWLMVKTCKNFVGEKPLKFLKRQSIGGKIAFFFKTGYHYLRYAWNLVDLIMITLFYCHVILRVNTYIATSSEPNMVASVIGHPEKFMPFSRVMFTLVYSNNILSLLAMIMWVKLFKYLCMSSYFRLLVRILEKCIKKLAIFSLLLVCVFYGFSVAFFVGMGGEEENYAGLSGSFLVGFFLLIDGYEVNYSWFEPGKDAIMPIVFFIYIALIYFVLMSVAVAIVLDVYATSDRSAKEDPNRENPMLVFLWTYYKMMLGISLVTDNAEEHMSSEDLSIPLELLPGIVRRKWIEKKRKMQRIANETFAGMELYPVDLDGSTEKQDCTTTDWMLPSTRSDVFDNMNSAIVRRPLSLYDIPEALLKSNVSRLQLQRLMDEDETLPILLQEARAEKVIRRFKQLDAPEQVEGEEYVAPVKKLQGQVFGQVDALEKVKLDDDIPEVPEISELTESMSGAITSVRNKFRIELTNIIEATAVLFEHLVDLTQGIDAMRQNHDLVLEQVREQTEKELLRGLGRNFMKR